MRSGAVSDEQRPDQPSKKWWWRYDEHSCPVCGRGQGEWERTRTYDESEKGYHQHVRYDWCEG